jgi:hypothetical protein
LRTVEPCHSPPRAVRTPRAFKSLGDGAMRLGARRLNLADDRKDIRGEGVRLGALRSGALGTGLAEVDGVH